MFEAKAGNGEINIPADVPASVQPGPVLVQVAVMDSAFGIGTTLSNGIQLDSE